MHQTLADSGIRCGLLKEVFEEQTWIALAVPPGYVGGRIVPRAINTRRTGMADDHESCRATHTKY